MPKRILTVDQSTTSTKVYLIDENAEIICSASREHKKFYPKDGWVEHDPQEIYHQLIECCQEILRNEKVDRTKIRALTITNQRETVLIWDAETHQPIYPAIVWQCTRTADMCKELIQQGYEKIVFDKTGLRIDSYFSATKINWILNNIENLENKKLKIGTIDSWLIYSLTGEHCHYTDHSNASRTLLYNIHTCSWDKELCDIFHIPMHMLPEILHSDECFGMTDLEGLLDHKIPITGVIGDSQAAFFGQCCFDEKDIKMTVGTGCSMMMNSKNADNTEHGLVSALGYSLKNEFTYSKEAIVNCNAESLNWARDEAELFHDYSEINESLLYDSNQNVIFVPALTGLSIPYWNAHARSVFIGIQRSTTKKDMLRAVAQGIIYQLCDALSCFSINDSVILRVDGGISQNSALMQYLSDISHCTIQVNLYPDLSALGSFMIGCLYLKWRKNLDELKEIKTETKVYQPQMSEQERKMRMNLYRKAVQCALVMSNEMESK